MELSEESIHDVIHPTAALCNAQYSDAAQHVASHTDVAWDQSFLNPKNRINSLEIPRRALWRIDGCTAFGSQFYATPLFFESMPPLRIDVFVPKPSSLPPDIRDMLDVDIAFYTRDKERIAHLGLTRHILRILHRWASEMVDPRRIYENIPFGSKIVIQNLPINIADAQIVVSPAHDLEHQLLSLSTLRSFWHGEIQDYPPAVDIGKLSYVFQIHDSVCLVQIEGVIWIFKALTSYPKYIYHELRQLLRIPPHTNIVSRPAHLVTKKCSFGSKTAVLGFTLEYQTGGSIRDLVPFLELHHNLPLTTKAKWATQLSSALLHLRSKTGIFYPDLRMDNIVLDESGDVVMVDFEQRGVWCEFAAPEVNAIDYVRLLAVDEAIPTSHTEKYRKMLSSLLPGWNDMVEGDGYTWPTDGYNIAWACLTPLEQEACEVYMLGRVLWCIFEAASAPQRSSVWLSYRWEPTVEFPEYRRTPKVMRDLIDRCTLGRRECLTNHIVRRKNQLVLRKFENTGLSTEELVQKTASQWWTAELRRSEEWLSMRAEGVKSGNWNGNYYGRPTMRQVHDELKAFFNCLPEE